jgi:hypothetical protein
MSCLFAPVSSMAKGVPSASERRWCLLPGFPRWTGLGPVSSPPRIARMSELSMTAKRKSSLPAARNSARSCSRSRCHTPCRCHHIRRRKHVAPEGQTCVAGNAFHGIPVFRTKTIPSNVSLSPAGFLPAYWRCRSGRLGRSGSTRFQSSSETSGRRMGDACALPMPSTSFTG